MSEMVERVTKAIFGMTPDGDMEPVRCIARAAIAAMREPTPEIIKAHHVVPDDTNFDERAADNWRNLIDAILVTEPAE